MKRYLPIVGMALIIVSGLFFIAGAPSMALMPRNYATFAGLACGSLAVLVWIANGAIRE
jgi:hypothetical protein